MFQATNLCIKFVKCGAWAILSALALLQCDPASAQTKPTEPRSMAFVMLADDTWPTSSALLAAIKKRMPAFEGRPSEKGKELALVGVSGGKLVTVMFIGAPNPISANESFIRGAWWWHSVAADLAKRKAHVVVSVGSSGDSKSDQLTLVNLSAAVMETTRPIGIIWNSADAVWPAQTFLNEVNTSKGGLPIPMIVSVKLGRDTQFPRKDGQAAWLGMTYGLRAFGLKEVEYRGFEGEPPQLVTTLVAVAAYLIDKGDVIRDNHTMGSGVPRETVVNIEPSTLEQGKQVYRLRPLAPASSTPPGR